MRDKISFKGAKYTLMRHVALLLAVGLLLSGCLSAKSPHWDPIGVGDDSGPGPCVAKDLSQSTNGHGLTVTIRRAYCAGGRDVIGFYYVFVRSTGEKESRKNLVFRFSSTSADKPPNVTWVTPSELRISTGPFWINQVTKERTSVSGAAILYSLGDSACPEWRPWTGRWGLCYK